MHRMSKGRIPKDTLKGKTDHRGLLESHWNIGKTPISKTILKDIKSADTSEALGGMKAWFMSSRSNLPVVYNNDTVDENGETEGKDEHNILINIPVPLNH